MLWSYLRRKAGAAFLAGVHDALTAAQGSGPRTLTDEEAAKALLELLAGPTAAEGGTTAPPQLAAPQPNGVAALTEPPKRGPGRPRKFQDPPGPRNPQEPNA
jgi:hypothetical protein